MESQCLWKLYKHQRKAFTLSWHKDNKIESKTRKYLKWQKKEEDSARSCMRKPIDIATDMSFAWLWKQQIHSDWSNTTIYPEATCTKHWYTSDCFHSHFFREKTWILRFQNETNGFFSYCFTIYAWLMSLDFYLQLWFA